MPRQAMILHLYNAGLKTEEVAEIMQVTVETLRKHMARIYYKCGVHDRGAAIQKGIGYEHLQRVIQAEREAVAKLVEELDRDNDKHRNDNW